MQSCCFDLLNRKGTIILSGKIISDGLGVRGYLFVILVQKQIKV